MTILPDESYPVPDVLRCVTHAQGKHDPRFRADPCHTWRELPRWTCGGHDGWQGAAEQWAGRLNQLRLVLITPLSYSQERVKYPEERQKDRHYPFEWTKKLADTGAKLNSGPAKVLFFPSITNWFGRASGAGLIKRRCRSGHAVELALLEKHSMQ